MSFSSLRTLAEIRTLIGLGGALLMLLPVSAEAQIVRRFAGGGIQVNAPFVHVNVGRGGTSVQAPYASVHTVARPFFGRRRRMLAQPQHAAPPRPAQPQARRVPRQPQLAQQPQAASQPPAAATLAYPTAAQLATMDDRALIETLRDMMARLDQRLSRLKTGEGWRRHLVLGAEALGEPGAPPEVAKLPAMQKALPRFRSVADQPKFAKIANFPSFIAAQAALQESLTRFASAEEPAQPELGDPRLSNEPQPVDILPTPEAVELPSATRGERSILKRQ